MARPGQPRHKRIGRPRVAVIALRHKLRGEPRPPASWSTLEEHPVQSLFATRVSEPRGNTPAMPELRPEEVFASRCIRRALGGVEVRQHDDGSEDGMFDLEVRRGDRPVAAVEVTMAADEPSIKLWRALDSGRRLIFDDLAGGWIVALRPEARAREVLQYLPNLLRDLEAAEVHSVRPDGVHGGEFEHRAERLRIADLFQSAGTAYPGSVLLNVEQPQEKTTGCVADTGDAIAEWLGPWIRARRARKIGKLRRSGANERHLFVVLPGDADAPFAVTDLLLRRDGPLPTIPPDLPDGMTHVWVVSTWDSGHGMRWSPEDGWESFNKKRQH